MKGFQMMSVVFQVEPIVVAIILWHCLSKETLPTWNKVLFFHADVKFKNPIRFYGRSFKSIVGGCLIFSDHEKHHVILETAAANEKIRRQ